eukprot:3168260-Pleurochrysis_carterae.AAC.1
MRERWLALARPFRALGLVGELLGLRAGQVSCAQPREEFGTLVGEKVLGHVVGPGGGVEGRRLQPGGVQGLAPSAPALRRLAPAIGLELAGSRALAVEVDRPEGQLAEEFIPPLGVQAADFFSHAFVAGGQGGEVRDEQRLELDIGLHAHAVEQIRKKALIRIVGEC